MNNRNLYTLVLTVFAATAFCFAQKNTVATSGARQYKLQATYTAGIAQTYEITEHTSVERTHSDSSKKQYSRDVTYYATVRCNETKNEISTVIVNLDSLRYKFQADGIAVGYNSEVDVTPANFADLNNYLGPLNRPFNLTYSPYGEVSKIEGEQIDFWRNYFIESKDGLDSVLYLIWMQSLDNSNLLSLGDVQKRLIPGKSVGVDSSWRHKLDYRVDGVVYSDTVTSKLDKYTGGYFVITTTDTISAPSQQVHVYGVPDISNVKDGAAAIQSTLSLSSPGVVDEVTADIEAWFKATVSNETFTQKTKSRLRWKLTGQYQW